MADVAEERRVLYVDVHGEENDGLQLEIGPDGLLVGRAGTCDVIFQSREVSRRHAYFYSDGRHCNVEDLGSKNGLLVNGRRVSKTRLKDGDVVDLGPSRFTIRSDDSESGSGVVLPGAPGAAPARAADPQRLQLRHPLAVSSLVFAVLASVHWGFGAGAVVLALLSLAETRHEGPGAGRALAWAGLALGLAGGSLNAWFTEGAPRLYAAQVTAQRLECERHLQAIAAALQAYRASHGGLYPPHLTDLVTGGLLKPDQLQCPAATDPTSRPYAYAPPRSGAAPQASQAIVWDGRPDNHPDGGWLLLGDGVPQWLGTPSFAQATSRSGRPAAAPPPEAGAPGPEP
jgi:hypothetical protein